jgi:DNA repair exonuclease SbcCD ATPase subunit
MASLSLTIIEIVVLMLGAVILGITIHFIISSRRSFKNQPVVETQKLNKTLEDWKLRYFNDTEVKDKELTHLRKQLAETEENMHIFEIEAEELRKKNKELKATLEKTPPPAALPDKTDYMTQLRQAQASLLEHNEKINQLLGQIDLVKETEEKQQEILKYNEELTRQIDDLRSVLSQKEREISQIRQKENLTREMTSMLDNAYSEFHVVQEKMQKLEAQLQASKMVSMDYESIKEAHSKLSKDYEDNKLKLHAATHQNQELQLKVNDLEDELRDANFQRQQLQKRVGYLEELNHDLQAVSDANKKLEGQLKRIGELESMLNVIAEERDELARKQIKTP